MKRIICFLLVLLFLIGAVPFAWAEPALRLRVTEDVNFYLGLTFDASLPVYSNSTLLGAWVDNAKDLIELYGDNFQWNVQQISGNPVDYTWKISSLGNSYRSVYGYLNEMPAAVTNAVFEITCSIGTLSETYTVNADFLSVPLPTGVDGVPDVINVKVGDPVELNTQILPVGWNLPGYQVLEYFEGADDIAPLNYVYWKDGLNLIPTLTGDCEAAYVAEIDSIIIAKYCTLHVTEKDNWQLVLPAKLKAIDANAFYGVGAESVKIPDGTTAIGDMAFAGSSVRHVYVPASVSQFGVDLFPKKTIIFTPAYSPAEEWANNTEYQIIHAEY